MRNLTIMYNGKELKDVTGISYLEGVSKLRIISRFGDKLVSDDYDTESIVINIVGSKIDNKIPVMCIYEESDTEFIGVIGRYDCVYIGDEGTVRIIDKDLHWINLKVNTVELNRVREIASKGLGSLYVDVNDGGLGKIYNRTLEEDEE